MQKKFFRSALLDPPGRYTGNNFLFKGGLVTAQAAVRVVVAAGYSGAGVAARCSGYETIYVFRLYKIFSHCAYNFDYTFFLNSSKSIMYMNCTY